MSHILNHCVLHLTLSCLLEVHRMLKKGLRPDDIHTVFHKNLEATKGGNGL